MFDELRTKFMELAAADAKVNNGLYLNAPYKIRIEDETYKGSIFVKRQVDNVNVKDDIYTLIIERPSRHLTTVVLKNPYA